MHIALTVHIFAYKDLIPIQLIHISAEPNRHGIAFAVWQIIIHEQFLFQKSVDDIHIRVFAFNYGNLRYPPKATPPQEIRA